MGQFKTNYLAENGRRIPVIGQLSIYGSVKLLGILADAWGHVLPFIENLQAPTVPSGCGDTNTSNQNQGVFPVGPYRNIAVSWGSTVPARPAYVHRSTENPIAAACRVRDDFHRLMRHKIMWGRSRSCKHIVNTRVNCRGEGPYS